MATWKNPAPDLEREIAKLKGENEALRFELASWRGGDAVSQFEYDQVVAERDALREARAALLRHFKRCGSCGGTGKRYGTNCAECDGFGWLLRGHRQQFRDALYTARDAGEEVSQWEYDRVVAELSRVQARLNWLLNGMHENGRVSHSVHSRESGIGWCAIDWDKDPGEWLADTKEAAIDAALAAGSK